MGKSNNPEGRQQATDEDIIWALKRSLDLDNGKIVASAAEIAEHLPIGKQAVSKRMGHISTEYIAVKKMPIGQFNLYYISEEVDAKWQFYKSHMYRGTDSNFNV